MPTVVYQRAAELTMRREEYREVFSENVDVSKLVKQYHRVGKKLVDAFDIPGLARRLCVSIKDPGNSVFANVFLSAKTHKPLIRFRNIHGENKWLFSSMAQFVDAVLMESQKQASHIVKDSVQVASGLKEHLGTPDIAWATFDVDSCFFFHEWKFCRSH